VEYIDISMTDCVASLNSMAASASLQVRRTSTRTRDAQWCDFYDYYETKMGVIFYRKFRTTIYGRFISSFRIANIIAKGASFDLKTARR
jgi:crotonobetainyl-CoA:carnitine CoA-transferase CaiB-like acyl-CoA transferase